MVKEAQTEKQKTTEEEVENNASTLFMNIKKILFRLIVLGVIGYGAYWVYQNPQIFENKTEQQKPEEDPYALQIAQLQNQIAALQDQLLNLPEPDVSAFEEKVDSLEKQTLNVIDSKADAGIVLGMLTRVDKLESRLDKVVKISDDGALILSAAMLVKQAAAEGNEFIYEAEVLNQLTPESASIKKDVSVISEYARNGIVSKKELTNQFHQIYFQAVQGEQGEGGNWRERLNQKVSEYIKIRKAGEGEPISEINKKWQTLVEMVDDGKLVKAVKLIESSENDDIKQNQDLQNWLADAKNQISFGKAIRNIAAYSLAEMKVNSLKNKD